MAVVDAGTRYGDLCRLCATKTILGVNIYANEGTMRQIDKKIESCLPVQVHEADELPKMICEHCLYKLELCYDFRERAVRTEALLIDLFKELNSARVQNEQQIVKISHSMDVVASMDHPELIMVQHPHLLTEHNIHNVNEIDLSHLEHRDNMIVEHEIILAHQNVDMSGHSLDGIDLNHHELSQDLSNHSLQTQEILVNTGGSVHSIQSARYNEGSLELIHQQQQFLDEQYRLQHELHVGISENSVGALAEESQGAADIVLKHVPKHNKSIDELNEAVKLEPNECRSCESPDKHTSPRQVVHSSEQDLAGNKYGDDVSKHEDINEESNLVIDNVGNSNGQPNFLLLNEKMIVGDNGEGHWVYCNLCGKTFEQKVEFDAHYEQHFHKCSVCLAVFTNSDALNQHQKVHETATDESKCIKTRLKRATVPIKKEATAEQDESNSDSEDLHESNDQVEEEEDEDDPGVEPTDSPGSKRKKWSPKVCKECGKTYKTNYKLTEHMRKHTGEKPYKCSSCEKAFRSKIGLAQHEAKHTGHYDFSCPTCGKGFQCKSYLMVHQRVHSDVKPYPCTTCGRNFKTKQSLLDHTNRHLGVKPYMCEVCGRGFITKGLCKAHQKIHTGTDNRKYSCKVCNKMFVSKSYLQTHLRIHTGEKPFMCEVCGKGFLTRVDLRIHSTMHTGEKSYVCEMCGKAFARRDALRCHRRSHTGERPYSCDQCGQTFTQFSPMAIHKRLHTGERPYACEVCGKTFVSRSTMMSHSKKHVR